MRVCAPGSTANLGPGFDVLGMALSRHVWASLSGDGSPCSHEHIGRIAYEAAGGSSPIWFGFELEPSRGLGFSAAARAAGASLAFYEKGYDTEAAQKAAYPIVASLEGHGDNAAPAVFGGLHIIAGESTHRIAAPMPGQLLFWIPELETATDDSRRCLPAEVARADAVFNLGRIALLTAAIYEGRLDLLRQATEDQLHQPQRLTECADSRLVIEAALDAGAAAAWLSGSGPSVAIVTADAEQAAVKAAVSSVDGRVQSKLLELAPDELGAVAEGG